MHNVKGLKSSWFNTIHHKDYAKATIIAFHFAGGNSFRYSPWLKFLPDDINLFGVDLPGRNARFNEPLLYQWSDVISGLLADIGQVPNHPILIFGHSLGAKLAFEFTHALEQKTNISPAALVVSGCNAVNGPKVRDPIHHFDDNEFINELKQMEGTPQSVLENEELMSLFLPMLKADFCMSETYTYQDEKRVNTPMLILGGLKDEMVDATKLKEWSALSTKSSEVKVFDGGHFFLENHSQRIIELIIQRFSMSLPSNIYSTGKITA